jgi:agmatinase
MSEAWIEKESGSFLMEKQLGFLESDLVPASPDRARFHVIPVPYERTTSYGKGAALGPAAILEASQQLEPFDGERAPGEQGIHTQPSVDCSGEPEQVMAAIAERVGSALDHGALPVMLGGEHTVTLGAAIALKKRGIEAGFVQFDAHADLRNSYEGSPYSHACVMRRVHELGFPIMQLGVRDLCLEEVEYRRREQGILFIDGDRLRHGCPEEGILPAWFPKTLYITFDVDGLDSSLMPATGTPQPGGLGWYDALDLLHAAAAQRRVIGMDIVELAPNPHLHGATFVAAKLTYRMMGLVG